MEFEVRKCSKGGFNALVDAEVGEIKDELENKEVEFLSDTPHLAVIKYNGEKISIKPGKLVFRVEEKDKAEELAEELLG